MKISDKELDDLFTSRLHNFEVEPTANLWQNIDAQLTGNPKKRKLVSALQIAAGILIMLSISSLFLRKNESVKNKLHQKITKVVLKKTYPTSTKLANLDNKNKVLLLSAKNRVIKEALPKIVKIKADIIKLKTIQKPETELISTQTLVQNKPDEEVITPQNNLLQSRITLVPDASVSLKPQSETDVPQIIVKPPVVTFANNQAKTKHKRIRNIGDVVNLVMAKVDKRENKLIQFSDADDGEESNVTGINLGFISLKKEK